MRLPLQALLTALLLPAAALAQDDLTLAHEETDAGIVVYAANRLHCPVTVELTLDLDNMSATDGAQATYVVPALAERHPLTTLTVKRRNRRYGYSYRTLYNLGDHTDRSYDRDHVYLLPFEAGGAYVLSQGYDGAFSHRGERALDFTMPVGTPVTAARAGTVVRVVDEHDRHCPRESCQRYNNYVTVYHADGTFAEYVHLRLDGAAVAPGDPVEAGELIGYSGNTGWSTDPHLHFVVYQGSMGDRMRPLATTFGPAPGTEGASLSEGRTYTRP